LGLVRADDQPSTAKPLAVKWLVVATMMLDDAQNAILVNGYFSRYPAEQVLKGQVAPDEGRIDAALKRAGITTLDVVLAAHSHFDPSLDTPVAAKTSAVVAGSESTANIAPRTQLPGKPHRWHQGPGRVALRGPQDHGDSVAALPQRPCTSGDHGTARARWKN
jgi:L-ascorbate metabolism protein UlaG (beta-lactamase superfamily)